jgi:hypothetical protein
MRLADHAKERGALPSVLTLVAPDLFLGDRHQNVGIECSS